MMYIDSRNEDILAKTGPTLKEILQKLHAENTVPNSTNSNMKRHLKNIQENVQLWAGGEDVLISEFIAQGSSEELIQVGYLTYIFPIFPRGVS